MIYIRDPPTPMIFRNLTCYVVSMSPLREPSHRFDRTQQMSLSNFYCLLFFFFNKQGHLFMLKVFNRHIY